MDKEGLERFLSKRGFIVINIKPAQNGFLVHLKGKANEAITLFQSIEEKTPVLFTEEKPTLIKKLWSKVNAYIQSHTP